MIDKNLNNWKNRKRRAIVSYSYNKNGETIFAHREIFYYTKYLNIDKAFNDLKEIENSNVIVINSINIDGIK